MADLVFQVIDSAWNLVLPFFGIKFGYFILFIWSIPFVIKYTKMLF